MSRHLPGKFSVIYLRSPLVWSILAIADSAGGGLCGEPKVISFRTLSIKKEREE